jgi:hypothetical protein
MKRSSYLIIGLISLTLIPLELIWTRILSAEFFYTFAFLVLSVAILGLGLGGLALRLFQFLSREKLMGWYLVLTAVCALVGPYLVFRLAPDFSLVFVSWAAVGKVVLVVLVLMSAFLSGGMALSLLFKQNHREMPRLYMADLIGAGIGVVAAIWGMNAFGTPAASLLVALPVLIAALLTLRGWTKLIPLGLGVVAIIASPYAEKQLTLARQEPAAVILTHWDAMAKLKLYEFAPDSRGINIDNVANTPVYMFDGDFKTVDPDSTPWSIDVKYLVRQFHPCTFLSLGAGGGSDVLQALAEGAAEVHAVEINGYINKMMLVADTTGYTRAPKKADDTSTVVDSILPLKSVAEFSGHLYSDPRVKVVTEDARSYVRRNRNKFDVIYSLSSNTWAALASGSFALAENYLFTTEAFEDYWQSLSDSGYMMMEHQMYVPRLVSEVMEALKQQGVNVPTDHFAVYDLPQLRRKIILLSKRPLTDEIRTHALGTLTPENFNQIHLMYPPANDSVAQHIIPRIVANGWKAAADSAVIDISPVTDDRPYVAQLGLWKNFTAAKRAKVLPYAEFGGFPLTKVILLIILGVVVLIAVPATIVPYFRKGEHLRPAAWLYFFCIGLAFMGVEIVLLQKYSLLLGSSLYSVATVLLSLLIGSGIGSRFAARFSDRVTFLAIVGWIVLEALAFGPIARAAGALELVPRILVAIIMIAPLGFFMGMPFPKGTSRVGEFIDWGFAVNGAASVMGSVLVLMVAFAWGLTIALLMAAAVYLVAYLLLRRQPVLS